LIIITKTDLLCKFHRKKGANSGPKVKFDNYLKILKKFMKLMETLEKRQIFGKKFRQKGSPIPSV